MGNAVACLARRCATLNMYRLSRHNFDIYLAFRVLRSNSDCDQTMTTELFISCLQAPWKEVLFNFWLGASSRRNFLTARRLGRSHPTKPSAKATRIHSVFFQSKTSSVDISTLCLHRVKHFVPKFLPLMLLVTWARDLSTKTTAHLSCCIQGIIHFTRNSLIGFTKCWDSSEFFTCCNISINLIALVDCHGILFLHSYASSFGKALRINLITCLIWYGFALPLSGYKMTISLKGFVILCIGQYYIKFI